MTKLDRFAFLGKLLKQFSSPKLIIKKENQSNEMQSYLLLAALASCAAALNVKADTIIHDTTYGQYDMDEPETEQAQSSRGGAIGALTYAAEVFADMARLLAVAEAGADKLAELEKESARNASRISDLES